MEDELKKNLSAKLVIERMKDAVSTKKQSKIAEILKISPSAISDAIRMNRIPDRWLEIISEKTGVTREELTRPAVKVTAALEHDLSLAEDSLPMVRHYRQLASMDADTLGEIQTWLNDMERYRPGFIGWFRLEFQNRFPEFDDWKNGLKKRAGNHD